jgi:uncharacterized membrane protein YcfT
LDDRREDVGSFSGDLLAPVRPVRQRLEWADVAKGVCIVLVVLWHVIMKDLLQIDWHVKTPFLGAWGSAGELLLPLRMPLFFAISGFFAANAVRRPWTVIGRTKVAKFLYLYALWLCVHTLLFSVVPDFGTERADSVLKFLAQLTITPSNLWYLQALAIYFVVAKVSLRVPPLVMLAAAFALSATAAAELVATPGDRGGLYQNLVFFLAGLYGRSLMLRVAEAATWLRLAAVAVPYLGILVAIEHFGFKTWFGLWPAVSFVAIFLGVTLFSLVTHWAALTRALTSIGRRTLPVYVMHMPILALLHLSLRNLIAHLPGTLQLAVSAVEPAVMTTLVVWICLMLHRILPTTWVFDLPAKKPAPEQAAPSAPASSQSQTATQPILTRSDHE